MIVECERNNITSQQCVQANQLRIRSRLREEQVICAKDKIQRAILNGIRRMSSFM